MAKMTKKFREHRVVMASIKAVAGYSVPILKLREVSEAARRTQDAGGEFPDMVLAARETCEKVGERTDQWAPLPGEAVMS